MIQILLHPYYYYIIFLQLFQVQHTNPSEIPLYNQSNIPLLSRLFNPLTILVSSHFLDQVLNQPISLIIYQHFNHLNNHLFNHHQNLLIHHLSHPMDPLVNQNCYLHLNRLFHQFEIPQNNLVVDHRNNLQVSRQGNQGIVPPEFHQNNLRNNRHHILPINHLLGLHCNHFITLQVYRVHNLSSTQLVSLLFNRNYFRLANQLFALPLVNQQVYLHHILRNHLSHHIQPQENNSTLSNPQHILLFIPLRI